MSRVKGSTKTTPHTPTTMQRCHYCVEVIEDDNYLDCLECAQKVHIKCLHHASTPGDLLGDVFFDFQCAKCVRTSDIQPSTTTAVAREKVARRRMPWMLIITLALYNLSIKSKGLSHHGYFHWRTHIINFIDKNWDYLFEPNTRRRKQWIGSISGALSVNNPEFFLSGQELFNETGWWKLTHSNQTPRYIYNLYEQQKRRKERNQADENSCSSDPSTTEAPTEAKRLKCTETDDSLIPPGSCSRTIPYMGRGPKLAKQLNIIDEEPLNAVQSSLMELLSKTIDDDLSMYNGLSNIAPEPLIGGKMDFLMSPTLLGGKYNSDNADNFFEETETKLAPAPNDFGLIPNATEGAKLRSLYAEQQKNYELPNATELKNTTMYGASENSNDAYEGNSESENENEEDDAYQPRIVQVTNFQDMKEDKSSLEQELQATSGKNIKQEQLTEEEQDDEAEPESDDDADNVEKQKVQRKTPIEACKPSLFKKTTKRNWPWLVEQTAMDETTPDTAEVSANDRLTVMSTYEEKQLLNKLKKIFAFEKECQIQIPTYIRRFYRKLCVRQSKRQHNQPVFNLDDFVDLKNGRQTRFLEHVDTQILDRYQLIALATNDSRKSFQARIAGPSVYEMFESPYTQRILHPFIFRSETTFPPWLKMLCELKEKVNGTPAQRDTIDYCYVQPYHIAAVNALLQSEFWPGIDMAECLTYPDYSVVALYKKLVIGCGFLVPDVGFNEAYISFMAVRPLWQRSGVATFMLYHLIQTCMTKDITLHVSATNPAVILYQKFGFKIEEVILDFYDKYLPLDSKHSRNALLLRLTR